MTLPLADDAFVFLWTTQKYLPDAFNIMKSWGPEYIGLQWFGIKRAASNPTIVPNSMVSSF